MATSGSYNMSSSYGTIRVEWWLISQSTSGNYSRVGWRAVATWASNTWLQVYSCNIWVNGAQVLARGSAQTWGGQFASGELNIGHNSNGTKNFGSNGNAAIYTAATNASGSGGWDLPNIARWASITGNGGNRTDETIYNTTVSFSNPANVQVGVKMEILGSPGINPFAQRTNISTASSGTYTWALTPTELEQLRTAMSNRTSATLRYTVFSTVSGETQYSYQDRTITIVNANPVFTDFTFKDSNAATVAITGNDQFIVQGYSTLQAFISAANKMQTLKEADPVRYRFQIGSIDVTENYIATDLTKELGTVGLNTTANLVVSAVDTRNLTTPVTKSVTILPYQAPQVNATAERVNNFETSTKIHVEGVISRLTVGGVDKNVVNTTSGLQYRYKKTDTGTWGAWQNIASSTSSGNVSMTDFYVNLDRNFAWNVEFRLTDAITNTSLALIVGVGIPIFRIGVDGRVYNNEVALATILDVLPSDFDDAVTDSNGWKVLSIGRLRIANKQFTFTVPSMPQFGTGFIGISSYNNPTDYVAANLIKHERTFAFTGNAGAWSLMTESSKAYSPGQDVVVTRLASGTAGATNGRVYVAMIYHVD